MKYLLVFAVLWVAIWLWRKNRREEMRETRREQAARTARPGAAPATPKAMLRCAHCGLHLPAADAVRGADGTAYCSSAHRLAATH